MSRKNELPDLELYSFFQTEELLSFMLNYIEEELPHENLI